MSETQYHLGINKNNNPAKLEQEHDPFLYYMVDYFDNHPYGGNTIPIFYLKEKYEDMDLMYLTRFGNFFVNRNNNLDIKYYKPVEIIEINVRLHPPFPKGGRTKYLLLKNNIDPIIAIPYKHLINFDKWSFSQEYEQETNEEFGRLFEKSALFDETIIKERQRRNKEHFEYLGVDPDKPYDQEIWNHLSFVDWFIYDEEHIPITKKNISTYLQIYHAPTCACDPHRQMSLFPYDFCLDERTGLPSVVPNNKVEWSCIYCDNTLQVNSNIKNEVALFHKHIIEWKLSKIFFESVNFDEMDDDSDAFDDEYAYVDYLADQGRTDEARDYIRDNDLSTKGYGFIPPEDDLPE